MGDKRPDLGGRALACGGGPLVLGGSPAGDGRWFLPIAVLFAAGVALRDSPAVVAPDVCMAVPALALAAPRGRSGSLRRSGVADYAVGTTRALAMGGAGMIPAAARDIRWREIASDNRPKQALAVARGTLIAAPLLLVFGACPVNQP